MQAQTTTYLSLEDGQRLLGGLEAALLSITLPPHLIEGVPHVGLDLQSTTDDACICESQEK